MQEYVIFLVVQMFVTSMLVGIAWFAQLVHYPLYKKIKDGFVQYERSHIKWTAYLVGPVMLIEAFTAILLVGLAPTPLLTKLATVNLISLILIWLFTFLFQIHMHQKLAIHFSRKVVQTLIHSHWVRTALWSFKGIILGIMIYLTLA